MVCNDPRTPQFLIDLIQEQRDWFKVNLKKPHRFTRSRHPFPQPLALSWFLSAAHEHIERARTMAALVGEQTFPIVMVTSVKPGMIVYRDPFQIAAVPFRN